MQSLVYEIPVVTALELRILPDEIPVFLEVTTGVAHRVVVLTLDEWTGLLRVFAVFLTLTYLIIHRAIDI